MSLKNILLMVRDIEQSKRFYHELIGLQILRDFGISIRVLVFRLSLISI
jgi:catechol-2,3-dioxygenase